jgi:hypothetical protein
MADAIAKTHSKLQDRLPKDAVDDLTANVFQYSGRKAKDVLGIEFHSFESCVGDTVTSLQSLGVENVKSRQ